MSASKEKINIATLPDARVLKICRNLWTWMAKHPDKAKEEWPGWKIYRRDVFCCPCCIKSGHSNDKNWGYAHQGCAKCLLKNYFKKGLRTNPFKDTVYCVNYSRSPWVLWCLAPLGSSQRTKAAKQMVTIIDKAMADLKRKE